MRARLELLSALFALGMAGGCGDGKKSIPLTELPPKLAQALCSVYEKCYGPVFELFLGGADCVATTGQRIANGTFPMLQGEIDQGKVVYDGSKAQACLDSLGARTCAELLERDSDECLAALDGTVPLGGACTLDEDCEGLAMCKSSTGTCPGQCTALLVAGQACEEDGDCQSGLQCSSETKLCVAPAADGQACDYGAPPCGPGLLCLGKDDSNKSPGTCKMPAAALSAPAGGACDAGHGQLCQAGSSCALQSVDVLAGTTSWSCVAEGSYAAGAGCKMAFPEACVAASYCKAATAELLLLVGGTCTPLPASGEACGSPLSQCQPGAVCISGVCQGLVPNGVSCAGDAMCFSGYCGASGGCQPRLPCR